MTIVTQKKLHKKSPIKKMFIQKRQINILMMYTLVHDGQVDHVLNNEHYHSMDDKNRAVQ